MHACTRLKLGSNPLSEGFDFYRRRRQKHLFVFLHLRGILRHFEKTFVGAAAGFFALEVVGSLPVMLHRLLQIDHLRLVNFRDGLMMLRWRRTYQDRHRQDQTAGPGRGREKCYMLYSIAEEHPANMKKLIIRSS